MRVIKFNFKQCEFEFYLSPNAIPFQIIDENEFLSKIFHRLASNPSLLNGTRGRQTFYIQEILQDNNSYSCLLISPGNVIQTITIASQEKNLDADFQAFRKIYRPQENQKDPLTDFSDLCITDCQKMVPDFRQKHANNLQNVLFRASVALPEEVVPQDKLEEELEFTKIKRELLSKNRDDFSKVDAQRKALTLALQFAKEKLTEISANDLLPSSFKIFTEFQASLHTNLGQKSHLKILDEAAEQTQKGDITSQVKDIPSSIQELFLSKYALLHQAQEKIFLLKQPFLNTLYGFAKQKAEAIKVGDKNRTNKFIEFNKLFDKIARINDQGIFCTVRQNLYRDYRGKNFKDLENVINALLNHLKPKSFTEKFTSNEEIKKLVSEFKNLLPPTGSTSSPNAVFSLDEKEYKFEFSNAIYSEERDCLKFKTELSARLATETHELVKQNSLKIDKLGDATNELIRNINNSLETLKTQLSRCKNILERCDEISKNSEPSKEEFSIEQMLQLLKNPNVLKTNPAFSETFNSLLTVQEKQRLGLITELESQQTEIEKILTTKNNIIAKRPADFTDQHVLELDNLNKVMATIHSQQTNLYKQFDLHMKRANAYSGLITSIERRIRCREELNSLDQNTLHGMVSNVSQCYLDIEARAEAIHIKEQEANCLKNKADAQQQLLRAEGLELAITQHFSTSPNIANQVTIDLFKRLNDALATAEQHKTSAQRLYDALTNQSMPAAVTAHVEVVRVCWLWVDKIEAPDLWERHASFFGGRKIEANSTTKTPHGIAIFHDALQRLQNQPTPSASQPAPLQAFYADLDKAVHAKLLQGENKQSSNWITHGRQAIVVLRELKRLANIKRLEKKLTRKPTTQHFYDQLGLLQIDRILTENYKLKYEVHLEKVIAKRPFTISETFHTRKQEADQQIKAERRKSKPDDASQRLGKNL